MSKLLFLAFLAIVHPIGAWELAAEKRPGDPAPGVAYVVRSIRDSGSARTAELHLVTFDARSHMLRVIDRPTQYSTGLDDEMLAGGYLAGTNGGYFTPQFEPLGLVVSNGDIVSPETRAHILSGVLAITSDRLYLLRNGEFKLGPRTREALQSGPFLVDGGRPVHGLNGLRRAARTFVATDGADRAALGVLYAPTLAEAGEILSTSDIVREFPVERALNLDGGRSTGFWVRTAPKPTYIGEISSVRNFLGLTER